ncbi:MAG: hypothetical protein ACREFD_05120 [Stellaceae bacterium]
MHRFEIAEIAGLFWCRNPVHWARFAAGRIRAIDMHQGGSAGLGQVWDMPLYTINFIDHAGNVRDSDERDCDTDEEAIAFAHDMNVPGIGNGFDIWHQDRLVHRHRRHGSST